MWCLELRVFQFSFNALLHYEMQWFIGRDYHMGTDVMMLGILLLFAAVACLKSVYLLDYIESLLYVWVRELVYLK
jgi:hypothetical protein